MKYLFNNIHFHCISLTYFAKVAKPLADLRGLCTGLCTTCTAVSRVSRGLPLMISCLPPPQPRPYNRDIMCRSTTLYTLLAPECLRVPHEALQPRPYDTSESSRAKSTLAWVSYDLPSRACMRGITFKPQQQLLKANWKKDCWTHDSWSLLVIKINLTSWIFNTE